MKKLLLFLTVIMLILLFSFKQKKNINYKELYMFQTSTLNFNSTINKFIYYNELGEIVKKEMFRDKGDISYNSIYDNYIYSYGPGGLYQTDITQNKTKKISNKNINIVHFYNNEMFYYENVGFKDNNYVSKICNKEKCLSFNIPIYDFVIDNEYYYILGPDTKNKSNELIFYIYKNNEIIYETSFPVPYIYQRILTINNRFFLFTDDFIYEINKENISILSENEIIKDINFEFYNKSNTEVYIIDKFNNNILILELIDNKFNINETYKILNNNLVSYSFANNTPIMYSIKNNILTINEIDNNKSEIGLNLNNKESVFMVYKLK